MQQQLRRIFDAAGVSPTGEDAGAGRPTLKTMTLIAHTFYIFTLHIYYLLLSDTGALYVNITMHANHTALALWGSGKWGQK